VNAPPKSEIRTSCTQAAEEDLAGRQAVLVAMARLAAAMAHAERLAAAAVASGEGAPTEAAVGKAAWVED